MWEVVITAGFFVAPVSPWDDVDLAGAIRRVDALGYNAIDFELLNFWPTDDWFGRGDDPRQAFPHYERGKPPWDRSTNGRTA